MKFTPGVILTPIVYVIRKISHFLLFFFHNLFWLFEEVYHVAASWVQFLWLWKLAIFKVALFLFVIYTVSILWRILHAKRHDVIQNLRIKYRRYQVVVRKHPERRVLFHLAAGTTIYATLYAGWFFSSCYQLNWEAYSE